jgi:hypothetical protein
VEENLFVPEREQGKVTNTNAARLLAKPLIAGEVLVSTLGNSFRTAYVDEGVPSDTHPVDGWVRLRFRETPAAWALLLSTTPIQLQATRITIGTAQQFIPPDALRILRLPVPARDVRERWQHAVERHHTHRRRLDQQWFQIVREISSLFDNVHRPILAQRPFAVGGIS